MFYQRDDEGNESANKKNNSLSASYIFPNINQKSYQNVKSSSDSVVKFSDRINTSTNSYYVVQDSIGDLELTQNDRKTAQLQVQKLGSVAQLEIDKNRVIYIKRGDLSIFHGELFQCRAKDHRLKQFGLVLKRIECLDRALFQLKVFQGETLIRFRNHPNIVQLYSQWSQSPTNQSQNGGQRFVYQQLFQVFGEAHLGDINQCIVLNPVKTSIFQITKYICDIAQGLAFLHKNDVIHAGVKPSNLFLNRKNFAMLGEIQKLQVDRARETLQFHNKLLIKQALTKHFVFWAPQLLSLENYDFRVDLWSLGITIYQLITGTLPFNVSDENKFKNDVFNVRVDYSLLLEMGLPKIQTLLQNLLRENPTERWSAIKVLYFLQQDFAVCIQRFWRGFRARLKFRKLIDQIVLIQATIRAFIGKQGFQHNLQTRKKNAALIIQGMWKKYLVSQDFIRMKRIVMKLQARVLAKQEHRLFLRFKLDVTTLQKYLRRYLAIEEVLSVNEIRHKLETQYMQVDQQLSELNQRVTKFKQILPEKDLPYYWKHLQTFEDYEMTSKRNFRSGKFRPPSLPQFTMLLSEIQNQMGGNVEISESGIKQIGEYVKSGASRIRKRPLQYSSQQQINSLVKADSLQGSKQMLQRKSEFDESSLLNYQFEDEKRGTGIDDDKIINIVEKYNFNNEYEQEKEKIRQKYLKKQEMIQGSSELDINLLKAPQRTDWEKLNEPHNLIQNILYQNEDIYKTMNPVFDFNLSSGQLCYVSEIQISFGLFISSSCEVYLANLLDRWIFIKIFVNSNSDKEFKFFLPGQQWARYCRIKFQGNHRGGNMICIQNISIKGVRKQDYHGSTEDSQ